MLDRTDLEVDMAALGDGTLAPGADRDMAAPEGGRATLEHYRAAISAGGLTSLHTTQVERRLAG